ncbi:MAG: DUF2271 domain-containing protein [Treponema sp.]|jgi:hypothetical protein|nr:DUF2271 domain-containing protein [Treponema sp.]
MEKKTKIKTCRIAAFCLVLSGLAAVFASAQSVPVVGRAEVSFVYNKQGGFASNQFAVWIEDSRGRHVKTLYATRFTAAGGWKKRELSLPLWVKQAGVGGMNKSQIDALTGPTPRSGTLRYVWDGTDQAGLAAAAGSYRVFVEAALRNENSVLYTADINLGASGVVTPSPRYVGSGTAERGMIGQVSIRFDR